MKSLQRLPEALPPFTDYQHRTVGWFLNLEWGTTLFGIRCTTLIEVHSFRWVCAQQASAGRVEMRYISVDGTPLRNTEPETELIAPGSYVLDSKSCIYGAIDIDPPKVGIGLSMLFTNTTVTPSDFTIKTMELMPVDDLHTIDIKQMLWPEDP